MNAGPISQRIASAYLAAPEAIRAAGRCWYPAAWGEALSMAEDAACDPARAAGVIAALSPRAQWSVNLRWARAILAARGGAEVPRVGFGATRSAAWRIANGEDPLSVLQGPKVREFYRAISGDLDAVTTDVWAVRAAVPGFRGPEVPAALRRDVQRAYRYAARRVGDNPRDTQAVVWLATRGAKPSDPMYDSCDPNRKAVR
jgi:hypothetical protein